MPARRIAIIAEWLDVFGGAEQVLAQLLQLYPEADLYAVVDFMPEDKRGWLGGRTVKTSFIQKLPRAKRWFRHYLPLMTAAVEQWDLSAYDLVISSSYAVAKGVLTGPDQLHVSYCHSPIRFAWDLQPHYLRQAGLERGLKSLLARSILHYMRLWDAQSGQRPDRIIANSDFIRRRIEKVYRRPATVIHPPVNLSRFTPAAKRQPYYVSVGRMVPYKRVDLIAAAFARMPERTLYLIGDGPSRAQAEAVAKGAANVHFLGALPNEEVSRYLSTARAFVFAAYEDFGIAPVEAQAAGAPVIAFGKGGALESICGRADEAEPTGRFFPEQTVESLMAAVEAFEQGPPIDSAACRRNAERFDEPRFRERIAAFINAALAERAAV